MATDDLRKNKLTCGVSRCQPRSQDINFCKNNKTVWLEKTNYSSFIQSATLCVHIAHKRHSVTFQTVIGGLKLYLIPDC